MAPIGVLKSLKKLVWRSSMEPTLEKESDLKITPTFKVTYPPKWEQRQKMTQKQKTKYFNQWASKL